MTDEITILRDVFGEVEPPTPAARDRARARLLDRIDGARAVRRPPRVRWRAGRQVGWAWRTGIATGIAVAATAVLAAGVIALAVPQRPRPQPPVRHPAPVAAPSLTAVGAIKLAADHAAAQPFTPPRPGQWLYVENRDVDPGVINRAKGGDPNTDVLIRQWHAADGTKSAVIFNGKLQIMDDRLIHTIPPKDYPTLAHLSTDPQVLLDWLYRINDPMPDRNERAGMVFGQIGAILRDNLLPPDVTAALLRAAALLPGVTQIATVTVNGRQVTAVGRIDDGWLERDLLFDPVTYAFIGVRGIAAADHRYTPPRDSAHPSPGSITVHNGDLQFLITRVTAMVVNAAGQTG